jgi:hypothetical protein
MIRCDIGRFVGVAKRRASGRRKRARGRPAGALPDLRRGPDDDDPHVRTMASAGECFGGRPTVGARDRNGDNAYQPAGQAGGRHADERRTGETSEPGKVMRV